MSDKNNSSEMNEYGDRVWSPRHPSSSPVHKISEREPVFPCRLYGAHDIISDEAWHNDSTLGPAGLRYFTHWSPGIDGPEPEEPKSYSPFSEPMELHESFAGGKSFQPSEATPTPRTEVERIQFKTLSGDTHPTDLVLADFARTLERELAQLRGELADAKLNVEAVNELAGYNDLRSALSISEAELAKAKDSHAEAWSQNKEYREELAISEARVKELEGEREQAVKDRNHWYARYEESGRNSHASNNQLNDKIADLHQQLAQAKNELEEAKRDADNWERLLDEQIALACQLQEKCGQEMEARDKSESKLATLTVSQSSNASDKERLDWLDEDVSRLDDVIAGACLGHTPLSLREAIDAARLADKGTEGKDGVGMIEGEPVRFKQPNLTNEDFGPEAH